MSARCPPMSAAVYPGRDVHGFYNCKLNMIFISCPREQHPWMSAAPQLKHTNPAYAERVLPAYFQFQLRPCGARMPPVGSSWDRGGATRPSDGGDHATLSGPYHSGRIQRLRDSWAKNLQSLELPHGWCGHHMDLLAKRLSSITVRRRFLKRRMVRVSLLAIKDKEDITATETNGDVSGKKAKNLQNFLAPAETIEHLSHIFCMTKSTLKISAAQRNMQKTPKR